MIERHLKEWESLPFGNAAHEIPETAAIALHRAALASNLSASNRDALALGRTQLTAKQTVGVVTTAGASLEILPKLGNSDTESIRERLIHMLSVAYDLPVSLGAETELGSQRRSLLEILIHQFTSQLQQAVKRGLPHRYRLTQDDLPMLRGKMRHTRQFTALAARPERIACEFDEFSSDTPLNQVMKAALKLLVSLSRSGTNQRLLKELLLHYSPVSDRVISALTFPAIRLDRTNAVWHRLFKLAQLFLKNNYQNTTRGQHQGIALLFEMNDLFELYISKLIKRELAGSGYQAVAQGGLRYCLTEGISGRGAFQTKPDILIRCDNQVVTIIDTKWKRYEPTTKNASQADIYQMMAYAQIYQCQEIVLLYPYDSTLGHVPGIQRRYEVANSNAHLSTATVQLEEEQPTVLESLGILPIGGHTLGNNIPPFTPSLHSLDTA